MLRSDFTGDVMVFAKEHNDRTFYSIGLSKKKMDGTYLNGYINVSFRKGEVVPNKTKIEIKKAWLDFYVNRENHTVPQIFISEFDFMEDREGASKPAEAPEGFAALDDDIPF